MAASQEKKKESFLLLLFHAVTVTWQGAFKCGFAHLKRNILYCVINLVFHIPLIWFLCKCSKSTQIYQVALNAFYKETVNDTASKKVFSFTQKFCLLAYNNMKENVLFVFYKYCCRLLLCILLIIVTFFICYYTSQISLEFQVNDFLFLIIFE